MRLAACCLSATIAFAGGASLTGGRANADQLPAMITVHCPHFTAAHFVMPGHSGASGNQYGLAITNDKTPCAEATKWATKLMAAGTVAGARLPAEVSGGPPGYTCYLTPDGSGHALGGTCHKLDSSGKLVGSWDWLALPNG
jgi:hypothetical protein